MRANLHYFVSDVHLGLDIGEEGLSEKRFVAFLRSLPENTASLYLLGDIFDFWYEYKYVVPKGYARVLGALAELSDRGVSIYFIKGNHDLWTFGYLEKEIGFKILGEPEIIEIDGVRFCLAHGDELGGKRSFRLMKKLFKNRFLQILLGAVHSRWVFAFARRWSRHNRIIRDIKMDFRGESDPLYKYAVELEKTVKVDNFIFGHMHTPGNCATPSGAGFYILGDWIVGCEYLVFDSESKNLMWRAARMERASGSDQNIE